MKVLEDVDTLSGLISWQVLPNFRALGPRLGPRVNEIKKALASADGSALQRMLDEQGWKDVTKLLNDTAEAAVRIQSESQKRSEPGAEIRTYDCSHFEPYLDPHFDGVVGDQIDFLTRTLIP